MTSGHDVRGMTLDEAVAAACGSMPRARVPLHGGCVAEVYRLDFDDRPPLVATVAPPGRGGLAIDGYMLGYLAPHRRLPVPAIRPVADDLLALDYVVHGSNRRAERPPGNPAADAESRT